MLALLLCAGGQAGAIAAQSVPLRPGNTVRTVSSDSAATGLWRVGTVLRATRLGVLVRSEGADTVPVPLDGSQRIQVRRRSNGRVLLGGGVGALAGGVLGATALGSTFGASWGDPGVGAEVVGFGLAGALLGSGIGLLLRPARWEEIPVTSLGYPVASYTRRASPVPLTKTERWDVFPATDGDFAAFFAFWEDSLQPVEGLWEIDPIRTTSVIESRLGSAVPRIAIVRDPRYEGYDYIAVRLPSRDGGTRARDAGLVLFALRPTERPFVYEVRYTASGQRQGVHWAELGQEQLIFRFRDDSSVEEWVKLPSGRP